MTAKRITQRITHQDRVNAVIHCTGFFIDAMNGSESDKQEAVKLAVKAFNEGASGANAVYQGYDLIRKRHHADRCLLAIVQTWATVQ